MQDFDKIRQAHRDKALKKKAEKRALIVVGSRWWHRTNNHLAGYVERIEKVDLPGPDPQPAERVFLALDDTGEEYRCPPEQLVDNWEHARAPAPPPKPEPEEAPKATVAVLTPKPAAKPEPDPAPKPRRKKRSTKKRGSRRGT